MEYNTLLHSFMLPYAIQVYEKFIPILCNQEIFTYDKETLSTLLPDLICSTKSKTVLEFSRITVDSSKIDVVVYITKSGEDTLYFDIRYYSHRIFLYCTLYNKGKHFSPNPQHQITFKEKYMDLEKLFSSLISKDSSYDSICFEYLVE